MGFTVARADQLRWEERPPPAGGAPRLVADITEEASLAQSRARIWRIPAGVRGRRHKEAVQEEVFVVLGGTLTMHLGDPPERVDLPPQSVVAVEPGTAVQMRNESDAEVVVFVYGAPPVAGQGELLEEVDL